jgi:hypothetical protein
MAMQKSTGLEWVEELLLPQWKWWIYIVSGAAIGWLTDHYFGGGTTRKLGQWFAFGSTVIFLFMQELESNILKDELVVVARQVEQLMNNLPADQFRLGVPTRLTDPKRIKLINNIKKLALMGAVFGAVFTWS